MALADQYRQRSEWALLELASLSVDIATDDLINLGLEPGANAQLLEAFRLQYPHVPLESLVGRSPEELQGFVYGLKGKYFEVLVADRLNSGEAVGDLRLELDQVAHLAASPTQAGWDIEISGPGGEVAEQIQLKATESLAYVRKALDRYPDIRVAVPGDIEGRSADVMGTGISHTMLERSSSGHISELAEGDLANALDVLAECAVDIIPLTSALLIGVSEGRAYLMSQSTLRDSMRGGGKRLGRAAVYSSIGTALSATGLGLSAIPVVVALRVAESRVAARIDLGDNLQSHADELGLLYPGL